MRVRRVPGRLLRPEEARGVRRFALLPGLRLRACHSCERRRVAARRRTDASCGDESRMRRMRRGRARHGKPPSAEVLRVLVSGVRLSPVVLPRRVLRRRAQGVSGPREPFHQAARRKARLGRRVRTWIAAGSSVGGPRCDLGARRSRARGDPSIGAHRRDPHAAARVGQAPRLWIDRPGRDHLHPSAHEFEGYPDKVPRALAGRGASSQKPASYSARSSHLQKTRGEHDCGGRWPIDDARARALLSLLQGPRARPRIVAAGPRGLHEVDERLRGERAGDDRCDQQQHARASHTRRRRHGGDNGRVGRRPAPRPGRRGPASRRALHAYHGPGGAPGRPLSPRRAAQRRDRRRRVPASLVVEFAGLHGLHAGGRQCRRIRRQRLCRRRRRGRRGSSDNVATRRPPRLYSSRARLREAPAAPPLRELR
mmetsp:Transcript_12938/g.44157  ORF Transcript_12938/g.44157 Transcript_12938/m.44157 type:complete len:425 (-) Transcript_12938:2185-3459(-)